MDEIYIYGADLPDGVNEVVTPCADGYTVYLANRLDRTGRIKAFFHAVDHILGGDFYGGVVQSMESERHG